MAKLKPFFPDESEDDLDHATNLLAKVDILVGELAATLDEI